MHCDQLCKLCRLSLRQLGLQARQLTDQAKPADKPWLSLPQRYRGGVPFRNEVLVPDRPDNLCRRRRDASSHGAH